MKNLVKVSIAAAMVASFAFTGTALAHIAPAKAKASGERAGSCFFVSQFDNWRAPNPKTLYIDTYFHHYYRLDLSGTYPMLKWPDAFLVMNVEGQDTICSAIDWDLAVDTSPGGFIEHIIVRKMTPLTPAEVAAIPAKFRP